MCDHLQKECCICMECISGEINCVTTECGHLFHTNCLMKNAAYNGFNCPYCRTILAESPKKDDDEGDDSDYDSDEEDYDDELYDDYALRGMRWLFQRLENGGELVDEEEDDDDEEDVEDENEEEMNQQRQNLPSVSYITQKLVRNGLTMEKLVSSLLYVTGLEYNMNRVNDEDSYYMVNRQIHQIINTYRPESENSSTPIHEVAVRPSSRRRIQAEN